MKTLAPPPRPAAPVGARGSALAGLARPADGGAQARPSAKPSPAFGGVGNWRLGSGPVALAERRAPDWRLPPHRPRVTGDPGLEAAAAGDRLWFEMRARRVGGLSFRRGAPLGRYSVGFLSKAARLIVEIEGEQSSAGPADAARRLAYLENKGFTLLRLSARDVLHDMAGVRAAIIAASAAAGVRGAGPEDAGDM